MKTREIVTEDINDFEYTPKPGYPGFILLWDKSYNSSYYF
jgi:hypothetical protein